MTKVFEYRADLKIDGSADYADFDGKLETIHRYEGETQLYVLTADGEVALCGGALLDVNRDGLGDPYVYAYQKQKMSADDNGYLFVYRGSDGAQNDGPLSLRSFICNVASPIEGVDVSTDIIGGVRLTSVLILRPEGW
jgi:hypothetical protein